MRRNVRLTDAILKKNFPAYEPEYTIEWWPNNDGSFHVECRENDQGNEVVMNSIKYVHELQRMLRTVKIKKEIVI